MTMVHVAPTWREAYDIAREQMAMKKYAGWGWAIVYKCSPDACHEADCKRDWVAEIA